MSESCGHLILLPMFSELALWHERFCQHCLVMKGQSPYTIQGYRDTLRSFVKFTGSTRIIDVTLSKVEEWITAGTRECGWSPVTSRGRIKYMVVFGKWLVREGRLEMNPLADISMPRLPRKLPRHLPVEQAEQLLRCARNCRFRSKFESARAYAIIATFIYTGLRKRELRELELRDIDLDHRLLTVRQGKGAKDRIIPIPPQLTAALEGYLAHRSAPRFALLPFFFVGWKAQSKVGNKVLSRLVDRLKEASGVYFAPHMLRHTYATLMLEGGCDIFSLSKLLGHADIKTTTIYLSASVSHLQQQVLKHPVCV